MRAVVPSPGIVPSAVATPGGAAEDRSHRISSVRARSRRRVGARGRVGLGILTPRRPSRRESSGGGGVRRGLRWPFARRELTRGQIGGTRGADADPDAAPAFRNCAVLPAASRADRRAQAAVQAHRAELGRRAPFQLPELLVRRTAAEAEAVRPGAAVRHVRAVAALVDEVGCVGADAGFVAFQRNYRFTCRVCGPRSSGSCCPTRGRRW